MRKKNTDTENMPERGMDYAVKQYEHTLKTVL